MEQQKLRGTIEQADEMIKSLDDCISELEAGITTVDKKWFLIITYLHSFSKCNVVCSSLPAELGAVEENGSEDKPSLISRQDGKLS